ncbi:putative bacteriocin export ABC transporter [Streptococcus pneumoniae]
MIEIKHLTKCFGKRVVFNDINLNLTSGKVYALTGSSGCGKTTLLNIIAKLESYDKGKILYKEKDINTIKSTLFFRNELGYLFQNFGLLDNEDVSTNLDLGLINRKCNYKEKDKLKKDVLARVGLTHIHLEQKIYELSGGEAQRVALAKIILKNPPLILADELTASLDPTTSQVIMKLLLDMKNENRLIIIATHNPDIWNQADEVINLNQL